MFDKEVTRQQIQSLNDLEAIVAFFAYFGYDTNSRIQQTPANLWKPGGRGSLGDVVDLLTSPQESR